MSRTEIVIADEGIAQTAKGTLGKDLNYQPFSSWYGRVKEKMETSSEITESIFFQSLEHIGAISRIGGQTCPPTDIYERMKGRDGEEVVSFYCKKNSNISQTVIESYGICLNKLDIFEDKYLSKILSLLNQIEIQIIEEKEELEKELKAKKDKLKSRFPISEERTRKLKRSDKQFRGELRETKDDVLLTVFREWNYE